MWGQLAQGIVTGSGSPERSKETNDMKVRDLMHKGIELASPDTPVATLAKTMREKDVGAIPIGSNGQLLGMVTDRDITIRAVANGKDIARLTAKDVMTKGVVCCNDSDSVKNALHTMEAKQIRRLPVVDENSKLVGMLSLGDISQAMPDRFAGEVMKAVSAHHA
jgi:CBS domain-containing protein